jgi:hypothetical protein
MTRFSLAQRTEFDFDVIGGPAATRPAPNPPPTTTASPAMPQPAQGGGPAATQAPVPATAEQR